MGTRHYGLQKRVGLRMLVLDPVLLLLDEPAAGINTEETEAQSIRLPARTLRTVTAAPTSRCVAYFGGDGRSLSCGTRLARSPDEVAALARQIAHEVIPGAPRIAVAPSANPAPRHSSRPMVRLTALTLWLVLWGPDIAGADGFRNPFQDAKAIGQGNAFAAQADDPSAIFYNPAGMAGLPGVQASSGVLLVNVHTQFTSPTGATVENDLGGLFGFPPPAQVFLTGNLGDLGARPLRDFTLGLGVQNLFGFASRYPEDGAFATAVTSASLPLLDFKPTLAYKVMDRVSLGLGADILTFIPALGVFERKSIWPGGLGVSPGAHVEVNGTGTGAGLNVSALATLLQGDDGRARANLGFVWRSHVILPLHGDFLADHQRVAGTSTHFRFPESFTVALAGWPVRDLARDWKVEVDVDVVRWSWVHDFDLRLSSGVVVPNRQHWRDSVTVGVGTEHTWRRLGWLPAWELALRAGYIHSMTPVPDANFDPAVPDANVNVFSIGAGVVCRPGGAFLGFIACGDPAQPTAARRKLTFDLAYQAFVFDRRTVTGNPNPTVNGTYRTLNQAVALTFGISF